MPLAGATAPGLVQQPYLPLGGGVLGGTLRLYGPVYDVRNPAFGGGAKGDGSTNDAGVITLADLAISSAGGGVLLFPPGDYRLASQVTRHANVVWRGMGPSSRLLQAFWPGSFQGTITASGTYTDANVTTLNADATAGDAQISVTSTAGIAAGDYLLLGSDRAYMDATATHDNVRYRGEMIRVLAVVDANTLSVYGFVQDNYAVADGASVKAISYLPGLGTENLSIENTDQGNHSSDFFYLLACRDFWFENVWLRYSDNVGIHLDHCRDGSVVGAHMRDFTDDAANSRFGYGVLFNRCTENIDVSASTFERMRHAVTTNGVDNKRGVPRAITVTGCSAMHMTNAAFDTHNQGAGIEFAGCEAVACETAGYQIRSADTKLIGCSASYVNTGVIVGDNGVGCEIRDNTLRHVVRKNAAGGYGIQVSGVDRVRIIGNTIDGVDRNFVLVQDGTDDLVIARNVFCNPGADGTSQSGVKVEAGATVTGLIVKDNDLSAYASSSPEGRSSGTLNHAIDLTTTTTASTVVGNDARNYAGNLVNNPGGSGNVVHSNNGVASREAVRSAGQGIKGQNYDRALAASTSLLTTNGTNATLHYMLVPFTAGDVISTIHFGASALATGVVLAKVGVCTLAGVNLAVSADQGTAWQTGTGSVGILSTNLTSPYVVQADGDLYLQILCVAGNGTGITVYRASSQGNINNPVGSGARPYAALASQTDITGTQAPGGSGGLGIWVGWS